MPHLKLFLLGPPRVEVDGAPIEIGRRKAIALLAYLALSGQSQSRDSLATLLWPDHSQSRARASLSRDLSILNRAMGPNWFQADRETIALRPIWTDVEQFRQKLADCESHGHPLSETCPECLASLNEAVALCQDDFLKGFTLPDCPDFDEWQFFQSEGLRQELASALQRLIDLHESRDDPSAAIPHARRWLALDPLHEPAHRMLMGLYAHVDQQAAALRQYQVCTDMLEAEFGLPPSEETTALYERIRSGIGAKGARGRGRRREKATAPAFRHAPLPSLLNLATICRPRPPLLSDEQLNWLNWPAY